MGSPLDVLGPHRGPCAFCGEDDARHRVADTICERVRAGDSVESVADDYEISVEAVARVVEANPRTR